MWKTTRWTSEADAKLSEDLLAVFCFLSAVFVIPNLGVVCLLPPSSKRLTQWQASFQAQPLFRCSPLWANFHQNFLWNSARQIFSRRSYVSWEQQGYKTCEVRESGRDLNRPMMAEHSFATVFGQVLAALDQTQAWRKYLATEIERQAFTRRHCCPFQDAVVITIKAAGLFITVERVFWEKLRAVRDSLNYRTRQFWSNSASFEFWQHFHSQSQTIDSPYPLSNISL